MILKGALKQCSSDTFSVRYSPFYTSRKKTLINMRVVWYTYIHIASAPRA